MGHVPVNPRPQFDGETDAHYDAYLHGEYRDYLVAMRDASPFANLGWIDMAIAIGVITLMTITALILLGALS